MTQAQRNQAIINQGLPQVGSTGGSCKDWVRGVVQAASANAGGPTRTIPSTQPSPNDYLWYPDPYAIGQSGLMENASIGWIVQMRLKSSSNPNIVVPHTAIISAKDATGFYFLDSNWANDNKVQNHRLNYVDFYAKLFGQGQYSLYYIQ